MLNCPGKACFFEDPRIEDSGLNCVIACLPAGRFNWDLTSTQITSNENRETFAPGNPVPSDQQSDRSDYKIILFAFLDQYILAIEKE